MRIIVLVGMMLALATAARATSPLWGDLQPGPYAVGVRTIRAADDTRPALPADQQARAIAGAHGRPMQITVWYPAERGGQPLPFEAYVLSEATRVDLSDPTAARRRAALEAFAADMKGRGATAAQVARLLATPTAAVPEARPAPGRFPLVIYAHVEPAGSGVTAEYLASQGYVVAVIPWKGTYAYDLDVAASGVETQAQDIAFVKSALAADTRVDAGNIAVVGMSFGAMGAVALAMRDPSIDAVASLDGGIGSPTVRLLQANPYYAPVRLAVPLAHLYSPDSPGGSLAWLDEIAWTMRWMRPYPGLSHADFTATPVQDVVAGLAPADNPHQRGFEAVNRDLLDFLDGTLRVHDFAAPPAFTIRPAAHAPGLEDLKRMTHSAIDSLQDPIPAQTLAELTGWLVARPDLVAARRIAELRRRLYPGSALADYTAGVVARRSGDEAAAKALFRAAAGKVAADFDPALDSGRRKQIAEAAL